MTADASKLLVTHDTQHGVSYVYLAGRIPSGQVTRSVPVGEDIVLDFDAGGALVGIELLRTNLLHPSLTAVAVPPGDVAHGTHTGNNAGMQADLALLAMAWKGITPDRNAQTQAEAEATEAAIDAAAARALALGAASKALLQEASTAGTSRHAVPPIDVPHAGAGLQSAADRYGKALEDIRRDIFYFMTRHDPNRAKEAYAMLGTVKERITSVLGS